MTMNVVIHDLVSGECELSGKANVECVRVTLDEKTPEAIISTAEFVKFLRFKNKQESKNGAPRSPQTAGKPSPQ